MIASLNGKLTSIGKSEIIIEVNGVGYFLNVPSKLIPSLGKIGSKLSLYTDMQIKDDKILMYGFGSATDQNLFRLLQSVQGIGPRAALSILSALTVNELVLAISSGDKTMICRADGIGPKVAGRITSELSEKISNMNFMVGNNEFGSNTNKENFNDKKLNFLNNEDEFSGVIEDAISALTNLGYTRSEVFPVLLTLKKDFDQNKINGQFTVNAIIPLALKELSKVLK